MENNKKISKNIIILFVILILTILGLGGYIIYSKVNNKDSVSNEEQNNANNNINNEDENTENTTNQSNTKENTENTTNQSNTKENSNSQVNNTSTTIDANKVASTSTGKIGKSMQTGYTYYIRNDNMYILIGDLYGTQIVSNNIDTNNSIKITVENKEFNLSNVKKGRIYFSPASGTHVLVLNTKNELIDYVYNSSKTALVADKTLTSNVKDYEIINLCNYAACETSYIIAYNDGNTNLLVNSISINTDNSINNLNNSSEISDYNIELSGNNATFTFKSNYKTSINNIKQAGLLFKVSDGIHASVLNSNNELIDYILKQNDSSLTLSNKKVLASSVKSYTIITEELNESSHDLYYIVFSNDNIGLYY